MTTLPPLTLAQRLRVVQDSRKATQRLRTLLTRDEVHVAALTSLLAQGVVLEDIYADKDTYRPDQKLWEAAFRIGSRPVFEALLDADAQAPSPLQKKPGFIHVIAAEAPLSFLDALIERGFALDEEADWGNMHGNALIAAVARARDDVLDRLLERGVLAKAPAISLELAKKSNKKDLDLEAKWLPPSLLHLALTPHAVRRLAAVGVPVDLEDGSRHTALETLLNQWGNRSRELKIQGTTWADLSVLVVAEAMVDVGVPLTPRNQTPPCTWTLRQAAVVKAFERNFPDVVQMLIARGAVWPEAAWVRPTQALALMDLGVPLNWDRLGPWWLNCWIDEQEGRAVIHEEKSMALLMERGCIDLAARNPATGRTPLVAAAHAGSHGTADALLRLGAPDIGCPPDHQGLPRTWREILITHDNDEDLADFVSWQPSLEAEAAQWRLAQQINPAPAAPSKPRL